MKIIHVCLPTLPVLYSFGGAIQRRIIEIATLQAKDGNEVAVYSIGNKNDDIKYAGFNVHYIKCRFQIPLKYFEYHFKVLFNIFNKYHKVDILQYHSLPEGSLFSHLLANKVFLSYDYFVFRQGKKVIFPIYRFFLMSFDKLLPVSIYCLEESKRYWRIPKNKFTVIYNGVNIDQFYPEIKKAEYAKEKYHINKKVILYVGRVCQQKGTHILIKAMELLNNRRNDLELVIAGPINNFGTSEDSSHWEEQIRKVNGRYLGPIDEKELSNIYNLADLFVMPTIDLEMFGMAAVEALACGKPIVCSDHGGLKEIVNKDVGLLFPVGDSNALANCIENLIDDDDFNNLRRENALKVAKNFSWIEICKNLYNTYI
jgi:glycosyltransferase involved in cell wall biosynthesis